MISPYGHKKFILDVSIKNCVQIKLLPFLTRLLSNVVSAVISKHSFGNGLLLISSNNVSVDTSSFAFKLLHCWTKPSLRDCFAVRSSGFK